jgi:7-cyano-7-deazaguanine synthase
MCAIYGYYGPRTEEAEMLLGVISLAAEHRGRDLANLVWHEPDEDGNQFVQGWRRATPTTEVAACPPQPYDGVCHNGTIANDKELGGMDGEVDSMVLGRLLEHRTSISDIWSRLIYVTGSYALSIHGEHGHNFLACNYKPLYVIQRGGGIYYASLESMLLPILGDSPFVAPKKVTPYSILDLKTGQTLPLPTTQSPGVVVVCSGGLDSATVAAYYRHRGEKVVLLHFLYGCRAEEEEKRRILLLADALDCEVCFLKIPAATLDQSRLVAQKGEISGGVEGAEYAHEWVPARNFQMLALAVGLAENRGYGIVAFGGNLEESGAYPDNEEELAILLNKAMPNVTQNGVRIRIEMPVGHLMKHEIVKLGNEVGTPWEHTYSCYHGGATHCGECGPCYMRRTAFERNGLTDPVFEA